MPTLDFAALSARYPGGIPEGDRSRAEAALEDAEAAVRAEAGLAVGAEFPAALVPLTLRVARREFSNPLGFGSETLADYTWRKDGVASGSLLTAEDREEIRKIMGHGAIASVPLSPGWSRDDVRRITPVGDPDGRSWFPDGRVR